MPTQKEENTFCGCFSKNDRNQTLLCGGGCILGADSSRSVYSSVFRIKERPDGKQPPPHEPAGRFPNDGFKATN